MGTTVINPQGSESPAGLIVGLVLAAIIIVGAIYFGLPYLQSMMNQQPQPATINVTVPIPAPAPSPTPAP